MCSTMLNLVLGETTLGGNICDESHSSEALNDPEQMQKFQAPCIFLNCAAEEKKQMPNDDIFMDGMNHREFSANMKKAGGRRFKC